MRKTGLLLLLITVFVTPLFGQSGGVKEKIAEIKDEYAPDKRVAIFNIDASEEDGKVILSGETNLPDAYEKLKENLKGTGIQMTDKVTLLPEEKLGDKTYGIVNLSVANMRSEPKHSAEMATQALLGTPLKVYKTNGYWTYVQTPDGYLAWMDGEGFELVNKARVDEWLKADKIIYTGDFGFAYTEADKNSQEVSDLVLGDLLELTGEEGEFYGVKFPDGREGYVSKEEAEKFEEWKKSREPNAKNILDRAFTFMGRPYLWGGTSSKGIDCSGFTKTIYMSQGVILPRDASQQVFTGNSIDEGENFENLKPGDLLFFGRKAEDGKKERVTHVGIYIGDKEFIHASGIVKVNSFDKNASNFSEYRLKGFLRARRILNSVNQNGITTFDTNSFFKGDF